MDVATPDQLADLDPTTLVAEHGPFLLLKTRAVATRDASFDEWESAVGWARSVEAASPFWVGDLVQYGEGKYGETYAQAIETTGLNYETLVNQAYVASHVPPEQRREGLSFSHHQAVAALPVADQSKWLDKAEAEMLTRDALRVAIKASQATEAAPVTLWLTVACTDIDDLHQLADRLKGEGKSVKMHAKD